MLHIFIPFSGDDWDELAYVVRPSWEEYANRHGYKLWMAKMNKQDNAHPLYSYQRYFTAKDYSFMLSPTDYLWLCDLDTLITNPSIPVESFLDPLHSIFLCENLGEVNSGSYILRGDIATKWIEDVIRLINVARCDNHAVLLLMDKYKDEIKIVPHPAFNSMDYSLYESIGEKTEKQGQWKPSHLLLHLAGMTPKMRVDHFKKI